MTPHAFLTEALVPALALLPPQMDSQSARAMCIAIALQESRLQHRRQIAGYRADGAPIYGPARGLLQFEMGGTEGVLEHHASRRAAAAVLDARGYRDIPARAVHLAFEHDDILAAAFGRLLLWTDPRLLPQTPADGPTGWLIYLATWRPGKAKPATWSANFTAGWEAVRV
jgi:hypothetical protein